MSKEMMTYSVLLLYPDYLCKTRAETYFNHTTANDPYEAAENVKRRVARG